MPILLPGSVIHARASGHLEHGNYCALYISMRQALDQENGRLGYDLARELVLGRSL